MSDFEGNFSRNLMDAQRAVDRQRRMDAWRNRWADRWLVTVEGEAEPVPVRAKAAQAAKRAVEGRLFGRRRRVLGVRPEPIPAQLDPAQWDRNITEPDWREGDDDDSASIFEKIAGSLRRIGRR